MPNFYRDNDDILFQFKHLDLDRIIELKEDNFSNKDKSDFAPRSIADARDSYERIMEVVGDISGNFVEPHAAEVDEEGAHFEDGEVRYAKGYRRGAQALPPGGSDGLHPAAPLRRDSTVPMTAYSMAIEIISRADAAFMNIYGLQCDNADTLYKFGNRRAAQEVPAPLLFRRGYLRHGAHRAGCRESDLQAVALKAHQDADGQWRLNGVKRFITNGCGKPAPCAGPLRRGNARRTRSVHVHVCPGREYADPAVSRTSSGSTVLRPVKCSTTMLPVSWWAAAGWG